MPRRLACTSWRLERERAEQKRLEQTWLPVWEKETPEARRRAIQEAVLEQKYPSYLDGRLKRTLENSHMFLVDCLAELERRQAK